MKTTLLTCLIFIVGISASTVAQSSRDAWDAKFNPKAVKQRQEQQYQKWIQSWAGRAITAADVKEFWRITLTVATPDTLSPNYRRVIDQNYQLNQDLSSGVYDFDAQDIADQMNVLAYRAQGKHAEAAALEQTRVERIRLRQQQQFYNQLAAQQTIMQLQITGELNRLRQEVHAARSAADAANSRASQLESQRR